VNTIVIDNPNATTTGTWTSVRTFYNGFCDTGGSDTNAFGTNYLFKGQGVGAAFVQFTPNIVAPGDYRVYQWHPHRADASTAVPFVIAHKGGRTTVSANQSTNSGNWSLLGQFNFDAGTNGSVRVMDNFPETGAVAIADGLKFVFVSGPATHAARTGLSGSELCGLRLRLAFRLQ
jgi:hypothetical protein